MVPPQQQTAALTPPTPSVAPPASTPVPPPAAPAGTTAPPSVPAGAPDPAIVAGYERLSPVDKERLWANPIRRQALIDAGISPPGPAAIPPPAAAAPVRVAQAGGLPPALEIPQSRGIDLRAAELMLRNAKTPEEVNRIGAAIVGSYQKQQQGAGDRFTLQHDANGNWFRVDKMTGAVTPLGTGQQGGYRPMTEAERKHYNVPENTGAFMSPDGKPHVLPGTASTKINVSPEDKGDAEYSKEQAQGIRKRFNNIVEEGDKAQRSSVDLARLSEIFSRTGPQGAAANLKTMVGPYLEALGINVSGLSDAQAVQSVIERMAPQQRVVGSGQQSDAEYKGFLRSLPTLMQSPEARQQVLAMLQSQNDLAQRRAQIIAEHDEGTIDRKAAMQQLRALPSHEQVYERFKRENADAYRAGQQEAAQRRDTGSLAEIRAVQEQNRAPARPASQGDYDSLEVGRRYVDPKDGKVYTKGVSR